MRAQQRHRVPQGGISPRPRGAARGSSTWRAPHHPPQTSQWGRDAAAEIRHRSQSRATPRRIQRMQSRGPRSSTPLELSAARLRTTYGRSRRDIDVAVAPSPGRVPPQTRHLTQHPVQNRSLEIVTAHIHASARCKFGALPYSCVEFRLGKGTHDGRGGGETADAGKRTVLSGARSLPSASAVVGSISLTYNNPMSGERHCNRCGA